MILASGARGRGFDRRLSMSQDMARPCVPPLPSILFFFLRDFARVGKAGGVGGVGVLGVLGAWAWAWAWAGGVGVGVGVRGSSLHQTEQM